MSAHPRKMMWGLCVAFILMLAYGLFSAPLIPYWDGQLEVERTFAMKSLMQAGSYSSLLKSFCTPQISVLTPQTLLYVLFPSRGDDLKIYAVLLLVFTYVPLAWGLFQLCKLVRRPGWAPALFLLCAGNNISFDYPHVLDLSTQTMALLVIALVFQLRWRTRPSFLHAAVFGSTLGLGFWVQPETTFLAVAIFVLSECLVLAEKGKNATLTPNYAVVMGSLLLVALPAVWIDQGRQILACFNFTPSFFSTSIFPLCLAMYYNLEMLLVAAVLVFSGFKLLSPETVSQRFNERKQKRIPVTARPEFRHIVLVFQSALGLGLLISFANQIPIDSWMFALPVVWILIFGGLEYLGFGVASITSFAACGFCFISLQIFLGWHNERFVSNLTQAPDAAEDWPDRFPLAWSTYQDSKLLEATSQTIREALPNTGAISLWSSSFLVNTSRLRWALNQYPNSYYFVNPVTSSTQEYDPSLLATQAIVIYDPAKLAGTPIEKKTISVLSEWLDKHASKGQAVTRAQVIPDGSEEATIYFLNPPLTRSDLDELKKSCLAALQSSDAGP